MVLALQKEDIDICAMITNSRTTNDGSQIVFIGCVRDDGEMDALEIEAFVPVAEKDLADIAEEAIKRFGLNSVDIIHRYGRLALGETILVILVVSAHRQEGYEGSMFIIEQLKEKVPIWKQELSGNARGEWVH